MIDKKILFSALLITLFAGCDAGEKIQDVIDDVKADYIDEVVSDVVDNSNDDKAVSGDNIAIDEQIDSMLTLHNEARSAVGVTKDLIWSDRIALDAQAYADTLAKSGLFEHDPKNHTGYDNGAYGENLYAAYPSKPSLATAAKAWIDEKQYYTYGKIGDSSTCEEGQQCGHYTQVVWSNTSEVGCAISQYRAGNYKGGYVIVCKYQTPGNYIGETPYQQ